MTLWQSLEGALELEVTSACWEESLERLLALGIPLSEVTPAQGLGVRFVIPGKDLTKVEALCNRHGEQVKVLSRRGIRWSLLGLLRRPVLLLGIVLVLALTWVVQTRVLFFRVEGNETIPTRQILEAAEESGLRFFALRREIRSEKLKNRMLSQVPGLRWVGINTRGCVATITLRERQTDASEEIPGVSHQISVLDGVVTQATAARGTLLVRPGEPVQRGQMLISGYTGLRGGRAEGEVYGTTQRHLSALTQETVLSSGEPEKTTRSISLLLGKKRINFGKGSGIWGGTCGRIYEQYYLTLPGGFVLPLGLEVVTTFQRPVEEHPLTETSAAHVLTEFARRYLPSRMIAGRIDRAREQIQGCRLEADYSCTEMLSRVLEEQIGETYGENRGTGGERGAG